MTVGFRPPEPPGPPRLEHVRDLWQMHRRIDRSTFCCGNFQNDVGLELRVGFSMTNLIHSELSRKGDEPLLARAEDLRLVLLGQGWIELRPPSTAQ